MKTFKYIDENILKSYAEECECGVCGKTKETYWFLSELINNDKLYDWVEYVCVDCLKTSRRTSDDETDIKKGIRNIVNSFYKKGTLSGKEREERTEKIYSEFSRTPKLPNFIQNIDWPYCCGDYTEFIGDAGSTYKGPYEAFEWWGYEDDCVIPYGIEGNMGGEDPVSLFRCFSCHKKHWTMQYT